MSASTDTHQDPLGFAVCLWFNDNAEEAVAHYTSIFEDSKVLHTARYPDSGQEIHKHKAGTVMTITFELRGQRFSKFTYPPQFPHCLKTPSASHDANTLSPQWPSTAAPCSSSTKLAP